MIEAITKTLNIMLWLGIVLAILAIVNILTGILINTWSKKEKFNFNKLIKGILKVMTFYVCATFVAIAFTMLPFINDMIVNAFNIELFSKEILNTFSCIGVFGIVISIITIQAKKAIQGITDLANLNINIEERIKNLSI